MTETLNQIMTISFVFGVVLASAFGFSGHLIAMIVSFFDRIA